MTVEIERLRTSRIEWKSIGAGLYSVLVENQRVLLRLNDFPNESLCTLILNGREVDLEVLPAGWSIQGS